MKLIDEIIDLLSAAEPNLTTALMKTKVLLHRLGEKELLEWVNGELNGYPDSASLPEYRVLNLTVRGTASNGAWRYSNQNLPLLHIDEDLRRKLDTSYLTPSIAVIEDYAKTKDLKVQILPEFYSFISEGLGGGYHVESAWGEFSAGAMRQVLTEVSSRLLDFLLDLSEQFPEEMEPEELKEKSKEVGVSDLFNHAVFGDNATIVVGDANTQHIKNSITKNDFESLRKVLLESGISDNDISELNKAIAEDDGSAALAEGQIGNSVSNWMAKMIAKAGSAAWDINVGAAGSLLATAIARYYGF